MKTLGSLRLRLVLASGAVAVLTLVAFMLASGWVTRHEVKRLLTLEDAEVGRLEAELDGAAAAVRAALERQPDVGAELPVPVEVRITEALELWAQELGTERGHGMLLLTHDRTFVSDTGLEGLEARQRPDGNLELRDSHERGEEREMVLRVPSRAIRLPGGEMANLFPVPLEAAGAEEGTSPEERFVRAVDRRLLGIMVLAALAALGLHWTVTRRLVRPVDRLIEVAGRLEAGERGLRAELSGDDELARLGRAFDRMSTTFEQTESLRRELVASVAHELRTPLTALRCQLEALKDGLLPFDAEQASSLYDDTRHLERLVADLQDLALAEAGQMRLECRTVDLRTATGEAIDEVRASHRSGDGRCELPALISQVGEGLEVRADPTRLRQVLLNLLTNAVRHAPSHGRITIGARQMESGAVEIWVADTGPGIPEEHLPHVFERFYRADPSRQRTTGGAGLGLAIVRQLAELHGGSARIESPEGGGTRVTVVLGTA
jgi:signal transduction histidine kinase